MKKLLLLISFMSMFIIGFANGAKAPPGDVKSVSIESIILDEVNESFAVIEYGVLEMPQDIRAYI